MKNPIFKLQKQQTAKQNENSWEKKFKSISRSGCGAKDEKRYEKDPYTHRYNIRSYLNLRDGGFRLVWCKR